MAIISSFTPFFSKKSSQEKKVKIRNSSDEITVKRKELISVARKAFSDLIFAATSNENRQKLEEKYANILRENVEETKEIEDVNDIAHLIFGRYLDVEIEAFLPVVHEKFPKLNEIRGIDDVLREEFRARAHMLHGISMEDPIIKAIKEVIKNRNFGDIKLDLREKL